MLYLANSPFLLGGTKLRNKCLFRGILPEKNRIQKTISHGPFPSSQVLHDTWYSSCPQLLWIFSMLWINTLTKAILFGVHLTKHSRHISKFIGSSGWFLTNKIVKTRLLLRCLKLKLRSPIIYLQYETLPVELVRTITIMKSKTKVWKK